MKFSTIKRYLPELILLAAFFLFSWWLMWHTFNYKNGVILIAAKAWSDFGSSIPLIRSFSWGKNWPPEYPLFPGEPIKYHFLFYLLVGMLEKIGFPLSWALNLPSLLGFFGLLVIIYKLAELLFEKKSVALLAVIFFLFNSSLSFLEFFKKYPLSVQTLAKIIENKSFVSFGPYDGKTISAFWNLNIYTNQRHLAASYFLILLIAYLLLKANKVKKPVSVSKIFFIGLIFGLLPFFHKVAFAITGIVLVSLLLYFPKIRKSIFFIFIVASLLALPQLVYQFRGSSPSFSFHPGYLIPWPLTSNKIISYWYLNLGLSLVLIPAGFLLANNSAKKLFLTILPLFLIGNLFQFSPEIAGNHKFFNFFIIIGNLFSAWAVYSLWRKKILGKILAPVFVFLMIFSGIIDFFPVKNDFMYSINDASKNPDVAWIKNNTPPDAVFLNSSFLYHPASLAGRKIFLGWPYFSWSAGYNTDKRAQLMENIWATNDKNKTCRLLRENRIYGVVLENKSQDFPINFPFWENEFLADYKNRDQSLAIYTVNANCQ
jgi:hypothetical protein